MSATLQLTHKAIGAEVRRGAYKVVVDGERVGSRGSRHAAASISLRQSGSSWGRNSWEHQGWQLGSVPARLQLLLTPMTPTTRYTIVDMTEPII